MQGVIYWAGEKKNKPGIPNVGDKVKILEVNKEDYNWRNRSNIVGLVGIVTLINFYDTERWIGFDMDIGEYKDKAFYKVKVRILK